MDTTALEANLREEIDQAAGATSKSITSEAAARGAAASGGVTAAVASVEEEKTRALNRLTMASNADDAALMMASVDGTLLRWALLRAANKVGSRLATEIRNISN